MGNTLRENVHNALVEKASFTEKVNDLVNRFYAENDRIEILAIIKIVIENGHPRSQKMMEQFKKNYEEDNLELEDMAFYYDMYEKYKERLKK